MATDTVLITHVTGRAWMRASDGSLIALHEGMRVPVDAHILTDAGASVTLQATGVPPVIVGQNTDMLVSEDLAAAQPQPADNAVTPPTETIADQVLAALQTGQDPYAALDPTAAVLTGGGSGGSSFTRLAAIVETVTPLGLAYPRPGSETPEFVMLSGVGLATPAEAAGPAGPTIDVPDHNNAPSVAPGTFSIFEGNTNPADTSAGDHSGFSGTFALTAAAGLGSLQFSYIPEADPGAAPGSNPDGGNSAAAPVTITVSAAELAAATPSSPVVIDSDRGLLYITGYNATTGAVQYTYWSDGAQDHNQGTGNDTSVFDTIGITVVDSLGRTTSGSLVANITDSVPTADSDTATVPATGEDAGMAAGDVLVNDVFGADGPAAGGGVVGVAAGNTGAALNDATSGNPATVGATINGLYGTLVLNADGSYTYTRTPGSEGGVNDVFTYTIKDGDGDLSHTMLTIGIADSTPSLDVPPPDAPYIPGNTSENNPVLGNSTDNTVFESGLPAGSAPDSTDLLAQGQFTINSIDGLNATSAVTLAYTDGAGDPAQLVLTAAQVEALGTTPQSVTTQYGTMVLNGYSQALDGTITVDYQYTLVHAPDVNDVSTAENFSVTVKDADGDATAPQGFTVAIVDDVPQAVPDTRTATEGGEVSGNVLDNDVLGADGAVVTGLAKGSDTSSPVSGYVGGLGIAGVYGTLILNADGSYTYKSNPDAVTQNEVDHFVYTITDGDGDTSTVTLDINVANVSAGADNAELTVNEAALPSGSDPSSTAETAGGTLAVAGATSYAFKSSTDGVGTHGTLTLNPDGTYTYTLTSPVDGTTANNGANTVNGVETFQYTATVGGGNTVDGTITVNVIDDVPSFGYTTNVIAPNTAGTWEGVLDFMTGADVVGSSLSITGITGLPTGWTSSPVDATSYEIFAPGSNTALFTVNLNGDGTYDVIQNADRPGSMESFNIGALIPNQPTPSYTFTPSTADGVTTTLTVDHADTGNGGFNASQSTSPKQWGVGNQTFDPGDSFTVSFSESVSAFNLTVAHVANAGDISVTYYKDGVSYTDLVHVSGTGTYTFEPDNGWTSFDYAVLTGVDNTGKNNDISVSFTTLSYLEPVAATDLSFTVNVQGVDGDGDIATSSFGVTSLGGADGDNTVNGTAGNDSLYGGVGNDTLSGGPGDDILHGGAGNDVFAWHLGDQGTTSNPAIDVVKDFGQGNLSGAVDPTEKDVLDLSSLLSGHGTDLTQYLQVSSDGHGGTIINVDTGGDVAAGHNQQIVVEGVDFATAYGGTQDHIITQMISDGKLKVDH